MTRLHFWLGLLILMTFLSGLAAGQLLSSLAADRMEEESGDGYAAMLVDRLELDREQERKLVRILNAYAEKERAAWKTYQEYLYREHRELRQSQSDLRQRTENEIFKILDPVQRQKWRNLSRQTMR